MIRGYLPGEPRFLIIDEVLTLHETGIDAFGGSQGVRDAGLLESALALLAKDLAENTFMNFRSEWAQRISSIFAQTIHLVMVTSAWRLRLA